MSSSHYKVAAMLCTIGKCYLEVASLKAADEGVTVFILIAFYPATVVVIKGIERNGGNILTRDTVKEVGSCDIISNGVTATRVSYGVVLEILSYGIVVKPVSYGIIPEILSYGIVLE